MPSPRAMRALCLVLAVACTPLDAALAVETCYCGNGRSIKTARDCSSACEGLGGATHSNSQDHERAEERWQERHQEYQEQLEDDADLGRAMRAREAAGAVRGRRRPVAPAPSNVTSVAPALPEPNTKGVACLDGKVLIPALPTKEQIVFCKGR